MNWEYCDKPGEEVPSGQHPVKHAQTQSLVNYLKKSKFRIIKTNPIWDHLKSEGPDKKPTDFNITTKTFHKFHEGSINEIPAAKFHHIPKHLVRGIVYNVLRSFHIRQGPSILRSSILRRSTLSVHCSILVQYTISKIAENG
jgi:hypothetical protein